MEKSVFLKFAQTLGFKLNEDAVQPIVNEYDMEKPDNWDEMSEEEKAAWMKEHMVNKNAATKPEPKAAPAAAEIPAEIMQLNELVKSLGGVESIKTLLLTAATVSANALSAEEQERSKLVESIIANSQFAAEELADVETPILRKMAQTFTMQNVNFGAFGATNFKSNKSEPLPVPSFFFAKKD